MPLRPLVSGFRIAGLLCLLACGDEAAPTGGETAGQSGSPPAAGAGQGAAPAAGSGGSGGRASAAAGGASSTGVAGKAAAGTAAPAAGSGGAGTPAAGNGGAGAAAGGGAGAASADLEPFSFFVTSYAAIQRLSGSENGFGGDLRFGKADGLSGADEICRTIAETSMPGSGSKGWRAFLSVTKDASGKPVHAIDRVGQGPWYDRRGRLVAQNLANLGQTRPVGADTAIINDLPNEDGVPNHAPEGEQVDNHDILTGSNETGKLYGDDWSATCHDWTSSVGSDGRPRVGHSWPRGGGGRGGSRPGGGGGMDNWMSALDEAGCGKGVNLLEMGGPNPDNPTVGSGGGYGGIYCFALLP